MVRRFIRSDTWTNSEDVTLQAAVAKYGLHNWRTIASMLQGKTASQCRNRWEQFLSPTINKGEWTTDEELLLVQLARTFPSQWQTISMQLGRTAQQCLERFTHLSNVSLGIDDQAKTQNTNGTNTSSFASLDFNTRAEHRNARSDAQDLDSTEQEALQIAQARIANTDGKKGKRRQRELKLQDARDMAALQRVREAATAGIKVKTTKLMKALESDQAVSVLPGERAELFDMTATRRAEEEERASTSFVGKRVKDIEAKSLRQLQKESRQEALARSEKLKETDAAAFVVKQALLDDRLIIKQRGTLVLPQDVVEPSSTAKNTTASSSHGLVDKEDKIISSLQQMRQNALSKAVLHGVFKENTNNNNMSDHTIVEMALKQQQYDQDIVDESETKIVPTKRALVHTDTTHDPFNQVKRQRVDTIDNVSNDSKHVIGGSTAAVAPAAPPTKSLASRLNALPRANQTNIEMYAIPSTAILDSASAAWPEHNHPMISSKPSSSTRIDSETLHYAAIARDLVEQEIKASSDTQKTDMDVISTQCENSLTQPLLFHPQTKTFTTLNEHNDSPLTQKILLRQEAQRFMFWTQSVYLDTTVKKGQKIPCLEQPPTLPYHLLRRAVEREFAGYISHSKQVQQKCTQAFESYQKSIQHYPVYTQLSTHEDKSIESRAKSWFTWRETLQQKNHALQQQAANVQHHRQ